MSVLWIYREPEQQWQPMPLDGESIRLSGDQARPIVAGGDAPASLIAPGPLGGAAWVMIASLGAGVCVNGVPLLLGIRVLLNRDAIRVGANECVYFSSESLAQVVPYPDQRAVPCARCKTDIAPGMQAVKCPKCGAWHHQSGDLACWAYHEKCARCDYPTAMDGQYHWSPEGL